MRVWGLARVLLVLSLAGLALQEGAPSVPPNPPTAASEPSSPPAASETPKMEERPNLDLTPDADGKLSQQQMQQLLRVVADKDDENNKKERDYTYIERDVDRKLDGKGETKSTEAKTYEVLEIYGEQVQRLIEKDDKTLSEKDAAKEEEKIQKIIDKRKNQSDADRRKREEKREKDREDGRKFVREVSDAYNFKLVGTELVGGREAWVIDGEPRQGYVPHIKEGKYLSKFRGRVWIDKNDLQLPKMDGEVLDTISWGLVLARIHKGTRFMLEQTGVNDEIWLQLHTTAKIDVSLDLVKNFNCDMVEDV